MRCLIEGGVESYLKSTSAGVLRFPALSVQAPETFPVVVSGPRYVVCCAHESSPDPASLPVKETVTGWLYQPLLSGPRSGLAVADGGVESYWSANVALAVSPAWSRHAPPTDAAALSGPPKLPPEHDATPEVESEPLNATATGWLYQPFASAGRAGAAVTLG